MYGIPDFDFNNPFNFEKEDIRENIKETSPGYYLLGSKGGPLNAFLIDRVYVGRSDNDLQRRLLEDKDDDHYREFTHFVCAYAVDEKEAFEKECIYYHEYKDDNNVVLLNEQHPDRPDNYKEIYPDLECPVAGCNELNATCDSDD
jgi:hypothetical protein